MLHLPLPVAVAHTGGAALLLLSLVTLNPVSYTHLDVYKRQASGRYDDAHQVLLDNQLRNGQPGYHVLTPLRSSDGSAILINRGWVALGESRQVLPVLAAPPEPVTITGRLAQPAQPGLRLGDAAGSDRRWPRVVPYVDYDVLSTIIGYPLQPAVVLLEPEAAGGYWRCLLYTSRCV